MQVTCPTCEAVLKAPEDIAGKKVKCNKCESVFRIPATEIVPAATALPSPQLSSEAATINKPESYSVGIFERFIKAAYVFTGYWVSEKPPPLPSKAATIDREALGTTDRFIKAAFAFIGFWATALICEQFMAGMTPVLLGLAASFFIAKSPFRPPQQNRPLLRNFVLGFSILFVGFATLLIATLAIGCMYSDDPRLSNPFVRGFAPFWILILTSVPWYMMQPASNWRERVKQNPRLFMLCAALIAAYIVCKSQIESKAFQPTKPLSNQISALVPPQPKVISTTDNKYGVTLVEGWQQVNAELKQYADKIGDAKFGMLGPDNVICWMDEEPKKDLPSISLDKYAETRSKIMSQSVADFTKPVITPITTLTLDHFPARRFEVRGVVNNNQVILTMTIIETPDDFCRIVVWATQSAFDKNHSDAEKIIASFYALK